MLEEIEGDLFQKFERDLLQFGGNKARRKFIWNVLRYFRPGIVLRNKLSIETNIFFMLSSYLRIGSRHLVNSKAFTLINVLGLSISIASFFLIVTYIHFELSFDQFHSNKDSIYRIGLKNYSNGELIGSSTRTFPGIRMLLKDHLPEVRGYSGFYKTPANTGFLFRYNGKIHNEPGGILNSDSSFFSVFPSLLWRGDPRTALGKPGNLVISQSVARKLFGDEDPIGKRIERVDDHSDGLDFTVSAVLKDIPENSHFHATIINELSDSWPIEDQELWGEGKLNTYINLEENVEPSLIASKLNAILRKIEHENPLLKGAEVFLQPVTDIHLSSNLADELEPNGSRSFVYIMIFIAMIILTIAWINYINLETARFISRLKEFGVRRVIGSRKLDIAFQFLIEYFLLTSLSIGVAAVILMLTFPHFSLLTGVSVNYTWSLPEVWLTAFFIFVGGSLLTGMCPALLLMKSNPVEALKGKAGGQRQGQFLRRVLVVSQFSTSIALIAFVLVISGQLDFLRKTNKGIEVEHIIALKNPLAYSNSSIHSKYLAQSQLQDNLLQNPLVQTVTSSSAVPGTEIGFTYVNMIRRNMNDPYDPTVYKTLFVSSNFIEAFGLKLLKGVNFSPSQYYTGHKPWEDQNWNRVILNEKAVRQLGFGSAEEALDQEVFFQTPNDFEKCRIIGIIEDYHHEAVSKEIYPTILFYNYDTFQQVFFSVKLAPLSDPQDALTHVQASWKQVFPDSPFEYFFLDDYYDQQFKSETSFSNIFTSLASIAIFIACLGVIGMTYFEANSRLKEISIRKVLGASIANLVALLSRNNFLVICISYAVSIPVIYLTSSKWLSSYPVRIEILPLHFIVPFIATVTVVALISIYQTLQAAATNPVDHLKDE